MKKSSDKNYEQEMAERILAYLHRNRKAKDTIEGIREWIIQEEIWRLSRTSIEDVVARLVASGWLRATPRQQVVYYSLNQEKAAQLEAYLKAPESNDS